MINSISSKQDRDQKHQNGEVRAYKGLALVGHIGRLKNCGSTDVLWSTLKMKTTDVMVLLRHAEMSRVLCGHALSDVVHPSSPVATCIGVGWNLGSSSSTLSCQMEHGELPAPIAAGFCQRHLLPWQSLIRNRGSIHSLADELLAKCLV